MFGLPVSHVGNVLIFALFFACILDGSFKKYANNYTFVVLIIGCFIIIGSISALLYKAELLLYFWSLKNYLRFFLLMLDCAMIIDKSDLLFLCKVLGIISLMHILITLTQFFFFDIRWDYLNGIFGSYMGGNAGVNGFLAVCTTTLFYLFFHKKINGLFLIVALSLMCLNAAISEIKYYFVELLGAIILYGIITRKYKQLLVLTSSIAVIVVLSVFLLYRLYPDFTGYFSAGIIEKIGVNYHDNFDSLSRLNQISGMTNPILSFGMNIRPELGRLCQFIGLGFGNAEYGTKEIFNSNFYYQNYRLWYFDFIESYTYAETGKIGVFVYDLLFVALAVRSLFYSLIKGNREFALFGSIFYILIIGIMFYDVSLRNNYGYLVWATMAVPMIMENSREKV